MILIAGFVEMWSAISFCYNINETAKKNSDGKYDCECKDREAWAVCAGLISCVFCVVQALMDKFCAGFGGGVVGKVIAGILFALWFCTMAVCTMQQPFAPGGVAANGFCGGTKGFATFGTFGFNAAGNGYYSTWFALAAATVYFFESVPEIGSAMGGANLEKKLLGVVLFASVIEMWHASILCDHYNNAYTSCGGMLAWSVAAGVISAFVSILFLIPQLANYIQFGALFLTIWWTVAMLSVTMEGSQKCDMKKDAMCNGVFLSSSNGFFGCWVALVASAGLMGMTIGKICSCCGGGGGGGGGGGSNKEPETAAKV